MLESIFATAEGMEGDGLGVTVGLGVAVGLGVGVGIGVEEGVNAYTGAYVCGEPVFAAVDEYSLIREAAKTTTDKNSMQKQTIIFTLAERFTWAFGIDVVCTFFHTLSAFSPSSCALLSKPHPADALSST